MDIQKARKRKTSVHGGGREKQSVPEVGSGSGSPAEVQKSPVMSPGGTSNRSSGSCAGIAKGNVHARYIF